MRLKYILILNANYKTKVDVYFLLNFYVYLWKNTAKLRTVVSFLHD